MLRLAFACVCASTFMAAHAEWPFPAAVGTSWQYALEREPDGNLPSPAVIQKIISPKRTDPQNSVRLETSINGELQGTDLLKNVDDAVLLIGKREGAGEVDPVEPPAIVLPGQSNRAAPWKFSGHVAGLEVALPQSIVDEEEVTVPAGKFRALRVHGEQSAGRRTITDRWFVRGVGWVKESVIERSPTGELLARNTLELTAPPSAPAASDVSPALIKPVEVSVSTSTGGSAMNMISAGALQIVARWRTHGVPKNSKIRAVWIAEDTGGVAPPEYQVDEATATVPASDAVGTFTLSRPEDGWAQGKYRVEIFLNYVLAETLNLTIGPSERTGR
jgi:hypothetical protein